MTPFASQLAAIMITNGTFTVESNDTWNHIDSDVNSRVNSITSQTYPLDHPYFPKSVKTDKIITSRFHNSERKSRSENNTPRLVPVKICRKIPIHVDIPALTNNGNDVRAPQFGSLSQIFMGLVGGVIASEVAGESIYGDQIVRTGVEIGKAYARKQSNELNDSTTYKNHCYISYKNKAVKGF